MNQQVSRITDQYGRYVNDIRISITHRCNLHCIYCHEEGDIDHSCQFIEKSQDRELSPADLTKIVQVGSELGIGKVKITGGEPLLRKDLPEIISRIRTLPLIQDISLVTNGTLLYEKAELLVQSGLDRINVSLDSLKLDRYRRITNSNLSSELIIKGIKRAIEVGLFPVKINMVYLKEINEDEIFDMISFAKNVGAFLQLIELIPVGGEDVFSQYHSDLTDVERSFKQKAVKIETRELQNRRIYHFEDGARVELVAPYKSHEFCANCHRIRLTFDGKLKPCLKRNDNLIDLIPSLNLPQSEREEKIKEKFIEAVRYREPYVK